MRMSIYLLSLVANSDLTARDDVITTSAVRRSANLLSDHVDALVFINANADLLN